MTTINAFHLPGLVEEDLDQWEFREYDDGAFRLRIPTLSPTLLGKVLERIRSARTEYLATMPVREIARRIDRAATCFQEPGHPAHDQAEALLPAITGYSPEMIRLVLDRMAADWREPALLALLKAELGDPEVLDGFRERPGASRSSADNGPAGGDIDPVNDAVDLGGIGAGRPTRVRAWGPELAFHIFAGNVPGVAVTSLIRALLVKSASIGKAASGEPLLAALFARTLAEVDPGLGECLAVTYWPGGEVELEDRALLAAETTIIYGGSEVVESIRARAPAGARIIEHGPRLSLGVIAREILETTPDAGSGSGSGSVPTEEARVAAAEVALATATFDQQGCVSPHMVYLERGGTLEPREFAKLVAEELGRIEGELPRGRLSLTEAATIQQLRGAAEFRAIGGRDLLLLRSDGTEYTVIYEEDPTFVASSLNRLLRLAPIDDLSDLPRHLEGYDEYLQTVGVAASDERRVALAEELGRIGVSRVTTLGAMPWPPPDWHHDGQEPLRELLRWTDLEG